jgi:Z1 domain
MPKSPRDWESDMVAAIAALGPKGPADLLKYVNIDREGDEIVGFDDLQVFLDTHNQQNNHAVRQLALLLAEWDFAEEPRWDSGEDLTAPRTTERRHLVYSLLRLPPSAAARLDEIAPVATMRTAVISTRWEPWYDEKRRTHSAFYWPHYRDYLLDQQHWSAESVAALDEATNDVIERTSDPSSEDTYQSKGVVVGYVQSGKTANFTGLIAKAVDAGYRLIIVMTGTIELLRSQTQRRLDRELVGVENLIRGLSDGDAAEEFDYADDDDWLADKFIRHGDSFIARGYPGIERMTLLHDDYKRLKQGLSRMQFHLRDRSKPFWDPENLMPADARLVVVKKNASVLKKLAQDLKPLKHKLSEIPALIIDDESDLASINTKDPRKSKERTAINLAITDLLGHLKRGQLVMYTATPFANFFVDPDDASDIFPKNFILALDRPPGYMGVADFHDVDWNSEDDKTDPATSNEKAYVRPVGPPPVPQDHAHRAKRKAEMQLALDSFVLAGAIKVYREDHGTSRYRHHTMLIHEETNTRAHRDQAELVREVWREAGYGSPEALTRLRQLWQADYKPVCDARADGFPVPDDFGQLRQPLGEACRRIKEVGDPILVVNSDPDVQKNQQALDFDRNNVWRILIGGAKLSRGFTVEGLTVSFYTRKALQGDTLMQAGRWFGFRDGYRDLVRLFIRRDPDDAPNRVDLYEAFEALMRDEMRMRERLHDYEGFNDDGTPVLEPWQVPPVVSQHLPYLRPTGRTKMFNARITSTGDAGSLKDYYGLPPRKDAQAKEANYQLLLPLLKAARERKTFTASRRRPEDPVTTFEALVGVVPAEDFVYAIGGMDWHPDYREKVLQPTLRFYQKLIEDGRLDHVVVIWPQLIKAVETRALPGLDCAQIITRSRRTPPRLDFVGSDAKHRDAPERIAGARKATNDSEADTLRDPAGRRAAALLYLAADLADYGDRKCPAADLPSNPHPGDLATLISVAAPATATPHGRAVIEWTVRRKDRAGAPTIPQQ